MRSPLNDALNRKWSEASATLEKLERELAAERERADRAKAEGIKEGMRRAAEIMRGRKVLASDFYYNLLLKEAGE